MTCRLRSILRQIAAEPLDAPAGLFQVRSLGGVGNAERGRQTKGGAVHHGDPFGRKQLLHEVLVGRELLARGRGLADGAGAGRIDIERALDDDILIVEYEAEGIFSGCVARRTR